MAEFLFVKGLGIGILGGWLLVVETPSMAKVFFDEMLITI